MLAKKKAAKKVAMKAAVEASRPSASGRAATPSDATGKRRVVSHARPTLSRRDVIEAGRGDGRSDVIKQIGDNVNTRLQEISFDDDIDADVFDDRKRELLEEARLAAGTQQRIVSDQIAHYVESPSNAARSETDPAVADAGGADGLLQLLRIRHNSNAVTAVAHLGAPPEIIVFGDKSGRVYTTNLAPDTRAQGLVHSSNDDARRQQKTLLEPAMNAAIVSLAISDTRDSRPTTRDLFEKTTVDMSCTSYTVAGAADGTISVWETVSRKHKGFLSMHKKPITGLSFRALTSTLFSVCQDGTLRVWSVPQMMAVDKLFGHEGPVYGVDALRRESCASVGQDGTMRFWNVPAATQQAYAYLNTYHPDKIAAAAAAAAASSSSGSKPSAGSAEKPFQIALECVAMLSEQLVVAGAVDGSLILFDVNRRKPLHIVPAAHGYDYHGDGTGLESAALQLQAAERAENAEDVESHPRAGRVPNPITAVAAVPYSDVIASASYDGVVRLWRVSAADSFTARRGGDRKSAGASSSSGAAAGSSSSSPSVVQPLAEVPVHAIVTSLRLSASGDALIVACSKEPRLGRWVVRRAALNSVCVFPLTEAGLKSYKHLVGLSIEHVPALLYGFKENEEDEEDEEDESAEDEEGVKALGKGVSSRTHNDDDNEDEEADDVLDGMDLANEQEGDEDEDDDDALGGHGSGSSPFFVVGADGQLQFRPSALPGTAASDAEEDDGDDVPRRNAPKTKKSSKNKKKLMGKGGVAAAATSAKTKKAKKASAPTGKKAKSAGQTAAGIKKKKK